MGCKHSQAETAAWSSVRKAKLVLPSEEWEPTAPITGGEGIGQEKEGESFFCDFWWQLSHLGRAAPLHPPSQVAVASLITSTPLLDLSYSAAATSCGDHGSGLERRGSSIEAALHPAAAATVGNTSCGYAGVSSWSQWWLGLGCLAGRCSAKPPPLPAKVQLQGFV